MFVGIAGVPDDLAKIWVWVRLVDFHYWLTSGEWLPWSIRAVFVLSISLLVLNPEWYLRTTKKVADTFSSYSIGWWKADLQIRWRNWREDRRYRKRGLRDIEIQRRQLRKREMEKAGRDDECR